MQCSAVHNMKRHLEELEPCILVLEQKPRGPGEPSISDSEAVSGSDDERYEPVGPAAARPAVQQKVKHEQPKAKEVGGA